MLHVAIDWITYLRWSVKRRFVHVFVFQQGSSSLAVSWFHRGACGGRLSNSGGCGRGCGCVVRFERNRKRMVDESHVGRQQAVHGFVVGFRLEVVKLRDGHRFRKGLKVREVVREVLMHLVVWVVVVMLAMLHFFSKWCLKRRTPVLFLSLSISPLSLSLSLSNTSTNRRRIQMSLSFFLFAFDKLLLLCSLVSSKLTHNTAFKKPRDGR